MRSAIQLGTTIAAAALLLAGKPAAAQSASSDSSAGHAAVYTAVQAEAGEAVFRGTCGNCHSTSQFLGPSFDVVWAGRRVFEFFDQLRSTMPLDNPGGLSRAEYAGVIAYILKLNDYPAGDVPLPEDDESLRKLKFERPDADTQRSGARRRR